MTDTDNHWPARGACRTVDPEIMYADDPTQMAAAKALCRACPVRQQCLDAALALPRPGDQWGVWGGYDHEERRRILNGATPQPCTVCAHPFVPSLDHQHRCNACNQPKGRPTPILEQHRQQITRWVRNEHLSDPAIAARLGTTTKRVQSARHRWNLPPGITLRPQPAPDPEPPQDVARPGMVDAVLNGTLEFKKLNLAERADLWRHHQAAGDTPYRFSRIYRLSWRIVRQIRDAADAQQRKTDMAAAA